MVPSITDPFLHICIFGDVLYGDLLKFLLLILVAMKKLIEKVKKFFNSLPGTFRGYLLWATIQHSSTLFLTHGLTKDPFWKAIWASILFMSLHWPNYPLMGITACMGSVFYFTYFLSGTWEFWLLFIVVNAGGAKLVHKYFPDFDMTVLMNHKDWPGKK